MLAISRRPIRKVEGKADQDHIEPAEAGHRPRAQQAKGNAHNQIYAEDQAHDEDKTAAVQRPVRAQFGGKVHGTGGGHCGQD